MHRKLKNNTVKILNTIPDNNVNNDHEDKNKMQLTMQPNTEEDGADLASTHTAQAISKQG